MVPCKLDNHKNPKRKKKKKNLKKKKKQNKKKTNPQGYRTVKKVSSGISWTKRSNNNEIFENTAAITYKIKKNNLLLFAKYIPDIFDDYYYYYYYYYCCCLLFLFCLLYSDTASKTYLINNTISLVFFCVLVLVSVLFYILF